MSRFTTVLAIGALVLFSALGCADIDGPVSIRFGSLIVTTSTTGSDLDPNGYQLHVDGALDVNMVLDVNDSATLTIVQDGSCTVELSEVAPNCSVDVNPVTVSVSSRSSAIVAFRVTCS